MYQKYYVKATYNNYAGGKGPLCVRPVGPGVRSNCVLISIASLLLTVSIASRFVDHNFLADARQCKVEDLMVMYYLATAAEYMTLLLPKVAAYHMPHIGSL